MKDVGTSPEIDETEYNEVLQKLVKVLKFRFNEALSIYKELYSTPYEEIAKNKIKFPQEELEQYKRFLEDALLMTKTHITVKPQQIQQLKGTLIKILEALAMRGLESEETSDKSQYKKILNLIETNIDGLEAEFAHEIIERFSNLLPEAIAEKYPLTMIRHNRKLAELLIEISKPSESILDLYDMLVSFTIAEAEKIRNLRAEKREPEDLPLEVKITPAEREILEEMKHFETLTLTQKALALIRLSFYGLFETLSSLTLEELTKYPIGVLKSAEKTLKELEQQELSEKEIQIIRANTDYIKALELLDKAIADYKTSGEKYDFISLYRETDYEVQGVSYCTFNDLILRMIQNIGEANFILNSTRTGISEERQHEVTVTITERYRQEWKRQSEEREKKEELELVKLAEGMTLPDPIQSQQQRSVL
jgi:predicted RNA-binding protein with EMAP domain